MFFSSFFDACRHDRDGAAIDAIAAFAATITAQRRP